MEKPLIMIVGVGDLSANVLNMLLTVPETGRIVLAGRNAEALRHRANLALFAASNLGREGDVSTVEVDLTDIDATAETIARLKPDIIFNGASLQSWRIITQLPKPVFEELDEAQFGPWLPMHLTLNLYLMQAVERSGHTPKVVNAAFPDAVNPVLARIGLAPTIGIGNVANIIPALRRAVADVVDAPLPSVRLRLVTQHYFSHYVPRFGRAGKGAYHLTAEVGNRTIGPDFPWDDAFVLLTSRYKRLGGVAGQLLTAASATKVLVAMAKDTGDRMHAPGPNGLPGGYPVRVGRDGGTLDLPTGLDRETAIRINETCQVSDGIARIDADGTVHFTEPEMAIMKSMLGYECTRMKVLDAPAWAEELGRKYAAFAARFA